MEEPVSGLVIERILMFFDLLEVGNLVRDREPPSPL